MYVYVRVCVVETRNRSNSQAKFFVPRQDTRQVGDLRLSACNRPVAVSFLTPQNLLNKTSTVAGIGKLVGRGSTWLALLRQFENKTQ